MATINKRRIQLILDWDKSTPDDLHWTVTAYGKVPDDSEHGDGKEVRITSDSNTFDRAAFRALTGAQIETAIKNKADDALDTLGSGAGGHTINDDTGN